MVFDHNFGLVKHLPTPTPYIEGHLCQMRQKGQIQIVIHLREDFRIETELGGDRTNLRSNHTHGRLPQIKCLKDLCQILAHIFYENFKLSFVIGHC